MTTSAPPPDPVPDLLNLKQVARMLDLHYMTVYRYVRQGRLPAQRDGSVWLVDRADVDALRNKALRTAAGITESLSNSRATVDWTRRLVERLVEGDEVGGWQTLTEALQAGRTYVEVHLEVVAGAVGTIGHLVAEGEVTPMHERVAVATATRLVARLGGHFPHRGRKRGSFILAAPVGEHHGLPLALVANLIRHGGFQVLELGTDTPTGDVLDAIAHTTSTRSTGPTSTTGGLVAVGIGVTTVERLDDAREMITTIRDLHPTLPVLLGGQAVRNAEVAELVGAAHWSVGPDLLQQLRTLTDRAATPPASPASPERTPAPRTSSTIPPERTATPTEAPATT